MLKSFPLADKALQLVPVVDPRNRQKFTARAVRDFASELSFYKEPASLDSLQREFTTFLLDDDVDDMEAVSGNSIIQFWIDRESTYPCLSAFIQALLVIPHSNAQSERVFSMLKKIFTEHRSSLSQESITSLLSIKLNNPSCCFDTSISPEMLRKLKKSAATYNAKHTSSSPSTSTPAAGASAATALPLD